MRLNIYFTASVLSNVYVVKIFGDCSHIGNLIDNRQVVYVCLFCINSLYVLKHSILVTFFPFFNANSISKAKTSLKSLMQYTYICNLFKFSSDLLQLHQNIINIICLYNKTFIAFVHDLFLFKN